MERFYLLALIAFLFSKVQDLHGQTVEVSAQTLSNHHQQLEIPLRVWILIGIALAILWGLAWWVMRKLKW